MKKLEELGISKVPWGTYATKKEVAIVTSAGFDDLESSLCRGKNRVANARLIASAPELYEALREAIAESCISYCGESPIHCPKKPGECFVQKWRTALAKAAGESEVSNGK